MQTIYHVRPVRNYDGLPDGWAWGLYVDGELSQVFGTEREAWAEVERLEYLDSQDEPNCDPEPSWNDYEALELAAEDESNRQEAPWQQQDRERN